MDATQKVATLAAGVSTPSPVKPLGVWMRLLVGGARAASAAQTI